jgi:flagellar hook-associated protein 2
MSTFSVGGLASGLDTKSIVDQLMQIEGRTKTRIEWKQQLWTARKSAWTDLNSRLLGLQTKANTLINPATWDISSIGSGSTTFSATSADPSRLSASATGPNAPVGLHTVEVLQLARGEISTSTGALAGATSGVRRSAVFYEGNNNIVEGNENITALRQQNGTNFSTAFNTGSRITMSWTVNGIAQNADFVVGTTGTNLTQFRDWVATTVGNGASAAWVNGALEVTTAPGTSSELQALDFTAVRSTGAAITQFNAMNVGTSTVKTAATDGGAPADTLTIANGSGSWNVAIASGDSKQDIVNKINATSGIGVTALLTGGGEVELRSNGIGAASGFTVTSAGPLAAQLGFTENQSAQDAQVRVDGTMYSRSANTGISDILTDVTLNLLGTTNTTLDIAPGGGSGGSAQDQWVSAAKKKIQDFVSAYNDVLSFVHQKTQGESRVASPKTLAEYLQGPMARDVGFSSVAFDMRRLVGDQVTGLAPDASMLSQIGINIGFAVGAGSTNGQLSIDDAKLDAMLRSDPDKVKDVLGAVGAGAGVTSGDGIARRISEQVSLLRVGGRVDTALTGATAQIKSAQEAIDRASDRLDRKRLYYDRMFSSLENTLGKLQSQGSWLSGQLAGLTGGQQ